MSINHVRIEEIEKLSSCERIAGYLFYSSKLAMVGARLRKNNRSDFSWTPEEHEEWDSVCDEVEPWWYALSDEEHAALSDVEVFMAKLTCDESVLEDDPSRQYKAIKERRD